MPSWKFSHINYRSPNSWKSCSVCSCVCTMLSSSPCVLRCLKVLFLSAVMSTVQLTLLILHLVEANRRRAKTSVATHVGPWGPRKCTIHGVVHKAAVQATSPQTSSRVSTTLPSSFHSVLSPSQGVQVKSLYCNTQGYSPTSHGVQESTLNQHHSDDSDHFFPPTGVQVSTVNLHPSVFGWNLQNYTVNNTEVQDIQSYVYRQCCLQEQKSSLAILDMRHRLSLSGHLVQFYTIDSVLFSSIMDHTMVKTAATWCYPCKSFDHNIGECPFPSSASMPSTPFNKTGRVHRAAAQGYQINTTS